VVFAGARPVFVEVDPDTFNLDAADVARRLGPRVKAVLAVHYGGQPADLVELGELASAAGVTLLEDAAEAHGARYRGRYVGGWGTAGMFSFTPTKNMTTGEGGMILTGDGDLADRLRLLRNHGQTEAYVHSLMGCNLRITEMQAAMGRAQLRKLPGILVRKLCLADEMDRLIDKVPGVQHPVVRPDRDHVHMLYTIKLHAGAPARDRVIEEMARRGIETRVYFPPVHRQPIFAETMASLPITDDLAGRILSLPIHSRLTFEEVEDVAAALTESMEAVCEG
jgi:perosamine synthetase